ncbi:1-deoxy-D-xylulose-5-phosphate synthase [Oryzihumus sp.]|uniref:1-deoxy-D-xylulose-5-phosphate synthase n=1 Tax=Oryzihumus sp. TaxID=1968903 RepID=UPI002ED82A6C
MGVLQTISSPADLRALPAEQMPELAAEIRDFLVTEVSKTGGHLGPNLGVVELTIALHRVFDSPRDAIVFDTGHQSYVHKLLTGRQDFRKLKKKGGLSGYPSRAESEHDVVENSHASTALSWADGIAKARRLKGERGRHTVAVIGDGALTGGMAWEAINNIAADKDLPLVIVVNDNERSYAPTTGGLADHLATLRTTRGYERFLDWGKNTLSRTPVVGSAMYETLHGVKKGLKDIVAPQGMFEDLGLKYLGPVDGHDEAALEHAFRRARAYGRPVLVHVITQKGRGYQPAIDDEADQFHAVGVINPETGLPFEAGGRIWTDEFNDEMCAIGERRPDVVAITAAMLIPVGLDGFAAKFPDRVFDVGIAEQHAVTMASGLAFGGMHPVVAVYATFLNRAFDQLLMDCALHKAGVTFVLDRAGITGSDGASHNGMWDMTLGNIVPGLRLAAPRDGDQVRRQLREAVEVSDAPTVIRFPKGDVADPVLATEQWGTVDVLHGPSGREPVDLLLVSVGSLAPTALGVAAKLEAQGHSVRVVDPRWVLPVSDDVVDAARRAGAVAVIEDNLVEGGIGSAVTHALREAGLSQPVHCHGIPKRFLEHASRSQLLEEVGLTADAIATALAAQLGHAAG